MSLAYAQLVIYASENGRDGWLPVAPALVPEWLKNPDVIARMVSGLACMDASQGEDGSCWYVAFGAAELPWVGGMQ